MLSATGYIERGIFENNSLFILYFYTLFVTVTQLSSWTVSVTTSQISADVQWNEFPLGESIKDYWLRFTDEKDNVSVLLPVNVDDKSYHVENLLISSHTYAFDLLAFTGEVGSIIYASRSVSVGTIEGGMF